VPENLFVFKSLNLDEIKSKFSGEDKGDSPHKILPRSCAYRPGQIIIKKNNLYNKY
tara:strand:+ start:30 stop:197 length:168 start_codon:yes stop_codon:yes gene_type:complete